MVHRAWLELAGLDLRTTKFCLRRLESNNHKQTRAIVSEHGPVVSMTSYGERIESVYLTVESIARGTLLPSRLILWLEDGHAFRNRPDSLRRLEERGLEVIETADYGPHTKYYPYIAMNEDFNTPLVTADDDTLYPSGWLKGLVDGFSENPAAITCFRAHTVLLEGSGFAPYVTWQRCKTTIPSVLNFATGVSGVLYPPAFQRQLKSAGLGFVSLCPKADDVWLHVQALRGGVKVHQMRSWQQSFPTLPGTQGTGLIQGNVHGSQNDIQIRKTYTASDILMLQGADSHQDMP